MIDGERLDRFCARRPASAVAVTTMVVSLPLLIALVDLHSKQWYPVLDLAMTEFRVRDVFGRHTPLIGLPGRITQGPGQEQGSHPGPLSFYLLAPGYRLFGSTSWSLQAATVVVHIAAVATSLWIGLRRGGWHGVLAVAALLAVAIRGYGQILLTQPWNPYLPLLAWIVVLLATWSVLCGDTVMLVPLVVAGTLCAQTHVPYLLPSAALVIGALVLAIRRTGNGRRALTGRRRHLVGAFGAGVALWVPPLIDHAVSDRGNVGKLLDHFGDPPEPVIGFADGLRLAIRHLDVWAGFVGFTGDLEGSGRFVSLPVTWRGAVTLIVWVLIAAAAWRAAPAALRRLHAVVAAAFVLGLAAMSRIFGLPWYYLMLWAWGVTAVMIGAIVWSAVTIWKSAGDGSGAAHALPALAAVILAASTLTSSITFADAELPEERLSDAVGALAGPTFDAVVDGVGAASGRAAAYQVRWSDAADIGSPGFGLLNELERRGLQVAADETFRVPVTDHRARPRTESDAQIHLATGTYIDTWRQVAFAVEVATYDPRSAAEVARFDETRARVIARLHDEGLDEVAAMIDTNLFGASLQPEISAADLLDMAALLELGQPMAVFIAPADADPLV